MDWTKEIPMMKCGHAANAEHDGKPACVICAEIKDGDYEIDEGMVLTGRRARCAYYGKHNRKGSCDYGGKDQPDGICRCETNSSTNLPFFEMKTGMDEFYCGCHGWD